MSGDILSGARTCVMEGHAAGARRDAVAVMTALRGYGGLNFSMACEVLIRDFDDIYPEWAQLAKIAWSLYLWQQREVSLCRTALRQRSGVSWGFSSCWLQCCENAQKVTCYTPDLGEGISPVCFEFLFRFILNARTEIILFQVGSMAMFIKCYLALQMCFLFVYKLFYFRVYRPPLYVHSCVRRAQVSALFIYFLKLRSRVNWRDLFYLK